MKKLKINLIPTILFVFIRKCEMKFLEILFWRKIAPFGGFLRHFAAKLFPRRILCIAI